MMFEPSTPFWAETHQVENQPPALENYNAYSLDLALQEGIKREGAAWATAELGSFGALTGSKDWIELGFLANTNQHDRHGHRVAVFYCFH